MTDIRVYYAYPSDLDIGNSFGQIGEYFADCGYKETPWVCEQTNIVIDLSDSRSLTSRRFPAFLKLLRQYPHPKSVSLHTHWAKGLLNQILCRTFRLSIDINRTSIVASVQSDDQNLISAIHEKVRELFRASVPEAEGLPAVSRLHCRKTVFLAYRFDDVGKKASAAVRTFLRRLGFDVVEGEGFEAMPIPDKVAERIRSQDILMGLVTPGDFSWVLSEAAFAKGLGKAVILLVQNDVTFNKGIIGGDYEHLPFPPDNVEKTFVDLLYALPIR
jgi:hypothetical protein